MTVPESAATTVAPAAAVALPLFVLAGALGCYFILRRSLRGLDTVNAAAASIGEGKDLSVRIGPVPGGRELTKLAENFDALLERLQRSFEAERRFTADASHELRTPVAVIKSACEYAEAFDETDEERRETLGMIRRQADKMTALIGQLLAQCIDVLGLPPYIFGQLRRLHKAQLSAPYERQAAVRNGREDHGHMRVPARRAARNLAAGQVPPQGEPAQLVPRCTRTRPLVAFGTQHTQVQ